MGRKNILDKEYDNIMIKLKNELGDDDEGRFDVYLVIINELKKTGCLNEFKYRLTDGENINEIILSLINKNKSNDTIWFLKNRIELFIDNDFLNQFIL